MSAPDWETKRKPKSSTSLRMENRDSTQANALVATNQQGSCACGGSCPDCQAENRSLPVSLKGDAGEVAADGAAERVIRGESAAGMLDHAPVAAGVARDGEGSTTATTPPGVDAALRAARGSGNQLDSSTRASMSDRFGKDFSSVRVHADTSAAALSDRLNAKAFTIGNDIYFNRGRFDPSSAHGERLLAHELAHVVQQGTGSENILQREIDNESANDTSLINDGTVDDELATGDEAEPMDVGGGRCHSSRQLHFLLANSTPFEITVPKGCTATMDFSALWVPVESGGGVECCSGKESYTLTRNGKNAAQLPVGANVCGSDEDVRGMGKIIVGGGRQKFLIKVNRNGCDGIKMDLNITISQR
jgi:hypothetical protein